MLQAVLEADTTYTLTVDVGDRSNHDFAGAELRLGTGVSEGFNYLDATVVANTDPFNDEAGDPGNTTDGWETWITTFTTGNGVIGDPLRIELINPGGVQTLFDNVRLTAQTAAPAAGAPEPSTLILAVVGLVVAGGNATT